MPRWLWKVQESVKAYNGPTRRRQRSKKLPGRQEGTSSRLVEPKSRDVPKGAVELQCLGQGLPEGQPGKRKCWAQTKVSH